MSDADWDVFTHARLGLVLRRRIDYTAKLATQRELTTVIKLLVVVFLVLIVGSLASGLYYLVKDKGTSTRAVKALTLRITLSIALFVLLMLGYYFGIIPKQGL
ncbi:MAG: twin transmembrane helix small protein [Burkholderiales bacterium]